jgi:hypothetical protein
MAEQKDVAAEAVTAIGIELQIRKLFSKVPRSNPQPQPFLE